MNSEHLIIQAVAAISKVSAESLDRSTSLLRGALLDSHATMELILSLESTFDIEFGDEDLTEEVFFSVASLAERINSKTGRPQP